MKRVSHQGIDWEVELKSSMDVLDGELMRTLCYRGEDKQLNAKRKYRAACGLMGMGWFQFFNTTTGGMGCFQVFNRTTGLLVGCT
jgi:hypothetical protein